MRIPKRSAPAIKQAGVNTKPLSPNKKLPAQKKKLFLQNKKQPVQKKELPPLYSRHTAWVDKQDIMFHFHLSKRTLQNLRSRKMIIWSKLGGKIYYNLPSFVAALENNREC